MLSKLQKSNLENRIIYSIHRSRIPDNIYPARGRKPQPRLKLQRQLSLFPTIFTPQGDGNEQCTCNKLVASSIPDNIYPARGRKHAKSFARTVDQFIAFPTIFTPQGDGNIHVSRDIFTPLMLDSRQYLPRKGTET